MATIEMNMLSVITCGSISVRVFCPGMDRLALDDKEHRVKYPVLWLLHTDGGAAINWLETPAERIAEKYGIFLIAPDQHHAMGTDMAFGPRYESFLHTELLNICRNCLPISEDPAENWIGGVGTGAYGAVKMALKHPDVFSKAVAINGILDMEALIAKAVAGEDTGTPHNRASLEAVFGDLTRFHGSGNDLFALPRPEDGALYLTWEAGSPVQAENERLAALLGAETAQRKAEEDFDACRVSLPDAVRWLMKP